MDRARASRVDARMRVLLLAFLICVGGVVVAGAQSVTTGAIEGTVVDQAPGEALPGVTVVVSSPALQGDQTAITDENGFYKITDLPPGEYLVRFYYNDTTVDRAGVNVSVNKSTPVKMQLEQKSGGEVIEVRDAAPEESISISGNYASNIPVAGPSYIATPADVESNTEAYARHDDNPYYRVVDRPLSTFSSDVDTASYANVCRFLLTEQLPPPDAVRVEEMLNYFHYDYPMPKGDAPVAITTEVGPSPFHAGYQLARIGLATRPIDADRVPPRNLVFLLDTSGSMEPANKQPLVKDAMNLLVEQLRPEDTVSIVVYAGSAGVVLPPTNGDRKDVIRGALAYLDAGGSTNGGEGIEKAYALARANFQASGINRVILCTDGDFNVGVTSEGDLTRLIEQERDDGIYLSVLGVGMGNVKDSTMEALADRGNGNYAYLDSLAEARKVLVDQAGATLVTVAKDVKLQIELNPAHVAGYRLIGYEDRLLADQDFNDDRKDAGDLGAGHAVTALYEIIPAGLPVPGAPVDKLKYQVPASTSDAAAASELMTVKVRYKPPTESTSKLITRAVPDAHPSWSQTSVDFRWAAAVAGFGMMLRGSPERGEMTWKRALLLARGAVGKDAEGYRRELVGLIAKATLLSGSRP